MIVIVAKMRRTEGEMSYDKAKGCWDELRAVSLWVMLKYEAQEVGDHQCISVLFANDFGFGDCLDTGYYWILCYFVVSTQSSSTKWGGIILYHLGDVAGWTGASHVQYIIFELHGS